MTLWKRGNVYWAYVHMDGVRHAKSTGTGNRRQAELVEQKFKDELNLQRQGICEPKPDMTFGELAARFLAEAEPRPYHIDRLKVLLPYWSETPIGRLSKARVQDYRKERHVQKTVSDTTVNRDLEALRRILNWAVDQQFLLANPLSRVPMVRERRKPRLIVSLAEERQLLAEAAPHLRIIVIAALDSGMRRGEIFGQRWEHIDFDRRMLYVTRSKTPGGEAREIPLTGRLFELLKSLRQPTGLIFTFEGRPLHRIKTAWKATLRRAKLRYFRFHDLRHTFNTRLMEAGVAQETRKSIMGHSSGEDVNSIYTHVELPLKREAIRKLEAWLQQEAEKLKRQEETNGRQTQDSADPEGQKSDQRNSGAPEANTGAPAER